MGDFFLDFRPQGQRTATEAAAFLKFFDDVHVRTFEEAHFSLVLTSVDDPDVWGPYQSVDKSVLVGLSGRIVLSEAEWRRAMLVDGSGGLACKAVFGIYREHGLDGLKDLNGNFALCVYDAAMAKLHLVTDPCGMTLAFSDDGSAPQGCASHPDVLAECTGESGVYDLTSLAQFVMTGSVTFPYTYYDNIHALEPGSVHTFSFTPAGPVKRSSPYFQFNFQIDDSSSEEQLADELASALQNAVRQRTQPLLGASAVALSGGLDSRSILSSVPTDRKPKAFAVFDKLNPEIRAAQRIAAVYGVPLELYQRDLEYYGRSFEMGVRIAGGMGSMASNHFLGIREQLRALGVRNLLTGCYCDYLFKGLAYNVAEEGLLRRQRLDRFHLDFYRSHFQISEQSRRRVEERLRARFPEPENAPLSEADWLKVEQKRTFPLAYEGDLAQRTIPQRVLPWYPPMVDRNLLRTYLKIPPRFKLDASIFRKMLKRVCPRAMLDIADSNSGAPVMAGPVSLFLHRSLSAALNRLQAKGRPQLATRGSWSSRDYFVQHSKYVRTLWDRNHDGASEILSEVLGPGAIRPDLQDYRGAKAQFVLRILTLKVWLAQRTGSVARATPVGCESCSV